MPTTGKTHEEQQAAATAALQEQEAGTEVFAANGALTKNTGIKALTKTSIGAYTLAAPTADEAGREIVIVAGTAFAHVVTATGLIDDGVTGGSKNTMTFGAFVGASITLMAYNLKWIVKSKNVVTVA